VRISIHTPRALFWGFLLCFGAFRIMHRTPPRRPVSQDWNDSFEILIDFKPNRRGGYVFELTLGTRATNHREGHGKQKEATSNGGGTACGTPQRAHTLTEEREPRDPLQPFNFTQSSDVVWGSEFQNALSAERTKKTYGARTGNCWGNQGSRSRRLRRHPGNRKGKAL